MDVLDGSQTSGVISEMALSSFLRVQFVGLQKEQEEDGACGAGGDEEKTTIKWTREWMCKIWIN